MEWMSQITSIAKVCWTWLLRLASLIWWMISIAVSSLWVGVRNSQDRIAETWTNQVIDWGLDGRHDQTITRIARVAGLIVILLSWVVTAEITVLVLRLVF